MLKERARETVEHGYTERLFVESRVPNGIVRIVDNFVDGREIVGCEENNLIRWRIEPSIVGALGRLGGHGTYVPFGKLMFFPAGVPYQTQRFTKPERNRNIICSFRSDLDEMLSSRAGAVGREQLETMLDINHGRLDVMIQRIGQELIRPGFATELLVESLLSGLAVEIARFLDVDMVEPADANGKGLSEVQLRRITAYIVDAREGVPTSAKLAELCGMTASSFRQRFKQATDKTIHGYVEEVRLNRAKSFLTDTNLSMKEIAYELGFTHQATFTTSFRRAAGMTPSEYRQLH